MYLTIDGVKFFISYFLKYEIALKKIKGPLFDVS